MVGACRGITSRRSDALEEKKCRSNMFEISGSTGVLWTPLSKHCKFSVGMPVAGGGGIVPKFDFAAII